MVDERWSFETPRDEMLTRVVTRGRRIRMINRALIGAAVAGACVVGVAGFVIGFNGGGDNDASVAPAGVGYHACPESGVIGELGSGDRVFLTGTDESGGWVQLRSPQSESARVWIPAEAVDPDEAVDLPAATCAPGEFEMAMAGVTETTEPDDDEEVEGDDEGEEVEEVDGEEVEEPGVTTTTAAPGPTTTTAPGATPTTAPATTAPPTTQAPTTTQPPQPAPIIGQLSRSRNQIWDSWGGLGQCSVSTPQNATTSVISITTNHASGATMSWNSSPTGISGSKPMSPGAGGTYTATLGPFPQGTVANAGGGPVSLNVSVVATGPGGQSPTSSTNVTLYECTLF